MRGFKQAETVCTRCARTYMNDALNESKVRNKEGRHAPTTTLPESAWQPVPTYTILVARFLLALREECSNLHSATNTLSIVVRLFSYCGYLSQWASQCLRLHQKSAQERSLLCFPARATVPFRHAWRPQVALSEALRECVVVRNKDGAELRSSQR